MLATPAFLKSDLRPHPDQPNAYLVQPTPALAQGRPGWVTVLPDGTLTVQEDAGEYQTARVEGNRIEFRCKSQYPTGCYAFPLVDDGA
jgi:hypothetical protein